MKTKPRARGQPTQVDDRATRLWRRRHPRRRQWRSHLHFEGLQQQQIYIYITLKVGNNKKIFLFQLLFILNGDDCTQGEMAGVNAPSTCLPSYARSQDVPSSVV